MQSEADAHSAPDSTAPETVAENPTTPPEDLPEPEFVGDDTRSDLLAWEQQRDALLEKIEDEPAGEAAEESTDNKEESAPKALFDEEYESQAAPEAEQQAEPLPESEEAPETNPESTAEESDDKIQPESEPKGPPAFRIKPRSEVEERAFQLLKEDKFQTLSLPDALAQADAELNPQADSDEPGSEAETPSPYAELSPDDLRQQIKEARTEARRLLKEEADFEAFADKDAEIERMEEALQSQVFADQVYNTQFEESKSNVISKYPVVKDGESDFARRVVEINEIWNDINDPRLNSPDYLETIADFVAKEQGVSPYNSDNPDPASAPPEKAGRTPKPQSQVPPRKTQAAPFAPSSGANRTQTAASQSRRRFDEIDDLQTWEAERERLLNSQDWS